MCSASSFITVHCLWGVLLLPLVRFLQARDSLYPTASADDRISVNVMIKEGPIDRFPVDKVSTADRLRWSLVAPSISLLSNYDKKETTCGEIFYPSLVDVSAEQSARSRGQSY